MLPMKIAIIGDSGVGKTSIVQNYTFGQMIAAASPTIGASFSVKNIVKNNINLKVHIWDTAGQERYRSISKIYYRGAHYGIFVFGLDDRDSFVNLDRWISEYLLVVDTPIIIIANKSDTPKNEIVLQPEEIDLICQKHNTKIIYTNAQSGEGIEKCFDGIITEYMTNYRKENDSRLENDYIRIKTDDKTENGCYC
jgi:Ras-related protein Rab-8A